MGKIANIKGATGTGSVLPFGQVQTVPVAANYAWINQGIATETVLANGALQLHRAGEPIGGGARIRKKSTPATPYVITCCLLPNMPTKDSIRGGFCWRSSSDGKLTLVAIGQSALNLFKFNDPVNFNTQYSGITLPTGLPVWIKASDDGSNRDVSFSLDGQGYIQMLHTARTDFHTPNEVGYWLSAENNSGTVFDAYMTLLSWNEA